MKETPNGGEWPIIRHSSKPEHAQEGQQQPKASHWLDFNLDIPRQRYGKPELEEEGDSDDEFLRNLFNDSYVVKANHPDAPEDDDPEWLSDFSERSFLRRTLSPYLEEYPFLPEDIDTLRKLRNNFKKPVVPLKDMANAGVYDCGGRWPLEERY